MSTTTRNYACIPASAQNPGPLIPITHALMVRLDGVTEPLVTLSAQEGLSITAYWVHYMTGKLIREVPITVTGPTTLHLVASKFPHLYCIVQFSAYLNCYGCSCPKGRHDHACNHITVVCNQKTQAA